MNNLFKKCGKLSLLNLGIYSFVLVVLISYSIENYKESAINKNVSDLITKYTDRYNSSSRNYLAWYEVYVEDLAIDSFKPDYTTSAIIQSKETITLDGLYTTYITLRFKNGSVKKVVNTSSKIREVSLLIDSKVKVSVNVATSEYLIVSDAYKMLAKDINKNETTPKYEYKD